MRQYPKFNLFLVLFLLLVFFSVIVAASPPIPISLTATPISSSQINLVWTASTGATGYNIYRCTGSSCTPTEKIGTSTTISYSDDSLSPEISYTYAVSAYDGAGGVSGKSNLVSTTTKLSGVFFSDGFESGDTSYVDTKSGAKWGGGVNSAISTDIAHSGKYSLKLFFKGDTNLSSDAWSEQYFDLGKNYDEVYIRFYIYYPSDYVIRNATGTKNSKLFYLWGDSYDNDMNKIGVEYGSNMHFGFKAKETGWPNFSPSCSGSTGFISTYPESKTSISDIRGKWTEIEIHTRRDTGKGDGIFQMWINNKLEINAQNITWIGAPCGLNKFFRHGYLMGWSNSGFDKDTDVYIDDVAFSNKYIGPVSTDTTPPTTPTNLVATPISSSQINLVWTASAGAIGYNIYRCTGSSCTPSTLVATSTINSYLDDSLSPETSYTYAVSAYDSVGNTSSHSPKAIAATKNSSNKIDLNYYKVVSATPKIISTPLTKAYPSVQYDIRLGVVGGLYPYTFSLLDSPSGMVIDKKKGEIRWTPDSSLNGKSFNVKVKVEDLLGQAVYQQYTLNVGRSGFYFVSPLGSDVNGDGSVSNPWATISYAINQRGSSDYLYVRGGNYIGPIEFLKNHLKTIIAYPGETPIIDYELSTSDPLESNTYIDGLKIHNIQRWAFSIGRPLVGFTLRRSELYDLYDNSVGGNPAFLFTWDAGKHTDMYKNIIIQDDVFHDLYDRNSGINGDTSANYHGGSVVWFDVGWSLYEGNTVYNIDGDCIKDKDDGHYNTFRSNYAYSCHSHSLGLKNQYTQYGIEVDHNIFERGIKIGSQPVPQYLENISIHDNTILGHIDVAVSLRKNLYFYNNIVYNPGVYAYTFGSKWCSGGSQNYSLLHFDDNLIFSDKKTFLSLIGCPRPNWRIDKTAEQAQVLGIDPHSYFTDPLFRNIANKDFTPQSLKACGTGLFGGDIGAVSCSASSSVLFSINSPVVSVVSQGHSGSNAVITWKTNKESTSQVNYGFDTLYKHQTVEDKTLTKLHVVKLEGLSSNASIYHYQVKSIDKDGNEVTSIDKTFITLGTKEGDSKKPSTIKNLKVSDITKNSALLTWSAPSNDFDNLIPSSATKQYDIRYSIHKITQSNFENAVQITGEPTPSTYGKTDTMQVVGLTPNMTYYIAIRSTDSSGNVSLISNVMKFTTSSNLITKISPAKVVSNGGGGGGYYYVEKTPLYKINNFIITPADKQITLTWSNSKNKNFVRVVIFRSTNKIKNGVLVKDLMKDKNIKKIYEGVGTKYVDINLNNFVTYYYAISAYDKNYNYSNPLIKEGKPESGKKFIQSFSAPLNQRKFNSVVSKQTYTIKQIVNTNLRPGLQNKEVLKLQKILSQDRDIYPEGIITGYYGNLTRKAVRRFQCKYKVVCSGSPLSTGYGLVGPKTRAKLNQIYTGVSNSSTLFSTSTKTTVTQNNNFSLNSKKTSNSTFVKYKSFSQREVIRSIQNQIATLLNIVSTLTKELNKMMGI